MRENPLFSRPHPLGILSETRSRNNIIPWGAMRTNTQQRDQDVHDMMNLFHTLRTKLGIKDSEKHLVLMYRSFLHRYIQEEMEFLKISSLSVAY
jgi:hypothetical protein